MDTHSMVLGNSEITVSKMALGTWAIGGGDSWGDSDERDSIKCIEKALDYGINYIDTAPAYGQGASESIVGKAISGKRSSYIISSKCGLVWGENDEGSVHKQRDGITVRRNLSTLSIRKQVEESLKRLGTDYIDVLITHWQSIEPFFTPIEETVECLEQLKTEGKILAYGASNVTKAQVTEYLKHGKLSVVQQKYSLLDRTSQSLMEHCRAHGITFQAFSPLERGMLTGTVSMDTVVVGTAKESIKWYKPELRQQVISMLDKITPLCTKYKCTVGNLILACTCQLSENMNVLVGARTPAQIKENANAMNIILEPDDIWFINDITRALAEKA